jgi:periplasmic protein CpxP/Spy
MPQITRGSAARALLAATCCGALLLPASARAQTGTPNPQAKPTQQQTSPPAPAGPAPDAQSTGRPSQSQESETTAMPSRHEAMDAKTKARVDAKIRKLHAELHVTRAQQPQWDALVQIMRDNAAAYEERLHQRDNREMTAIDELRAYQEITEQHAQDLQKLTTAFQSLYDTLSDKQKKEADRLFQRAAERREQRHEQHARR